MDGWRQMRLASATTTQERMCIVRDMTDKEAGRICNTLASELIAIVGIDLFRTAVKKDLYDISYYLVNVAQRFPANGTAVRVSKRLWTSFRSFRSEIREIRMEAKHQPQTMVERAMSRSKSLASGIIGEIMDEISASSQNVSVACGNNDSKATVCIGPMWRNSVYDAGISTPTYGRRRVFTTKAERKMGVVLSYEGIELFTASVFVPVRGKAGRNLDGYIFKVSLPASGETMVVFAENLTSGLAGVRKTIREKVFAQM